MPVKKNNLPAVEPEAVLKTAPTPLLAVDEQHRLLWVNDKAARSTATSPGRSRRMRYGNFLGCRHAETPFSQNAPGKACRQCELRKAIEYTWHTCKGVQFKSVTLTGRDGQPRKLEVSTSRISTPKGPAVVVAFEDLTERKSEDLLATANQHLTTAIETAGAICHDLSQPLMTISGYIQLMQMEVAKDSSHYARLEKIHTQVLKMAALTKKIMDLRNVRLRPGKTLHKSAASM